MPFEPKGWPQVPSGSSRTLPHAGLSSAHVKALEAKGYAVVDIRLLPSDSMGERAAAILHWFEGVRLGTIDANTQTAKIVEIEARACGLQTGKHRPDEKDKLDTEDIEALLRIGK